MAYEVTANRRRPQVFSDLAGQEFVVSTLTSAITSKRIAHAYLFSGPRGVGKTSSARILAKSLNCETGPTATPCGKCNNCKEITIGSSMDVIEIDGASNTSVNDIREIKDEILFAPSGSKYKIYIIDEVHMLSNSAFNALLKTIEEPPEYIIFIFATTEIHKVPATIRSRCQQFNFRLISTEILKDLIIEACNELDIKYTDEAVLWIAKEGNGSSRDAYTLFDQVASFSDGDITLDKIKDKLGLVGIDNLNNLLECILNKDSNGVLTQADYIISTGVAVEQFIIDLAEYFRNLLFLTSGVKKESLLGCSPERFSQRAIDSFSIEQLEQGLDLIIKLYKDIRYSINPRFELELLLSRLTKLTDYISNNDILAKIKSIKESITGGSFVMPEIEKKKIIIPENSNKIENNPAESFFSKFKNIKHDEIKKDPVVAEKTEIKEQSTINETTSNYSEDKNLDVDKEKVVAKLKGDNITLSSTITKSSLWEQKNSIIYVAYTNPFEANLVEREKNKILNAIREINPSIKDIVVKKETEKILEEDKIVLDDNVNKILTMFRGTIV